MKLSLWVKTVNGHMGFGALMVYDVSTGCEVCNRLSVCVCLIVRDQRSGLLDEKDWGDSHTLE